MSTPDNIYTCNTLPHIIHSAGQPQASSPPSPPGPSQSKNSSTQGRLILPSTHYLLGEWGWLEYMAGCYPNFQPRSMEAMHRVFNKRFSTTSKTIFHVWSGIWSAITQKNFIHYNEKRAGIDDTSHPTRFMKTCREIKCCSDHTQKLAFCHHVFYASCHVGGVVQPSLFLVVIGTLW